MNPLIWILNPLIEIFINFPKILILCWNLYLWIGIFIFQSGSLSFDWCVSFLDRNFCLLVWFSDPLAKILILWLKFRIIWLESQASIYSLKFRLEDLKFRSKDQDFCQRIRIFLSSSRVYFHCVELLGARVWLVYLKVEVHSSSWINSPMVSFEFLSFCQIWKSLKFFMDSSRSNSSLKIFQIYQFGLF